MLVSLSSLLKMNNFFAYVLPYIHIVNLVTCFYLILKNTTSLLNVRCQRCWSSANWVADRVSPTWQTISHKRWYLEVHAQVCYHHSYLRSVVSVAFNSIRYLPSMSMSHFSSGINRMYRVSAMLYPEKGLSHVTIEQRHLARALQIGLTIPVAIRLSTHSSLLW